MIVIEQKGITSIKADCIVNAANEHLLQGGGVCGVIFKAAGEMKLAAACDKIGFCKTGNAVITEGFDLCSYIIHAVGPRYIDGDHNEDKLLYSAYKQSLILCEQNGFHSVVFPLISAGIFGYPLDGAWRKALQACDDFEKSHPDYDLKIIFAIPDVVNYRKGMEVAEELKISVN